MLAFIRQLRDRLIRSSLPSFTIQDITAGPIPIPEPAPKTSWTRPEARAHVLELFPDISLVSFDRIIAVYPTGALSAAELEHIVDGFLQSGYEKTPTSSASEVRAPSKQ